MSFPNPYMGIRCPNTAAEVNDMDTDKIAYSLAVEDIQNESLEFIGRKVNEYELHRVVHRLGGILEWDFYVRRAIETTLEL